MDLNIGDTYILKDDALGYKKGVTFEYKGQRSSGEHHFDSTGANGGWINTAYPDSYFMVARNVQVYPAFNPMKHIVSASTLYVGMKLVLKLDDPYSYFRKGTVFTVINELPDQWLVRAPAAGQRHGDITVSKIDVWNWFSAWPGSDDGSEPAVVYKKRCEHKVVNVSFNGLEMRCKFCDKSEDEVKAEQRCEDTGGY